MYAPRYHTLGSCVHSLGCQKQCPYYALLYMQGVLISVCFICKVSLLFTALYTMKYLYCVVLHIQSVLIIHANNTTPAWNLPIPSTKILG